MVCDAFAVIAFEVQLQVPPAVTVAVQRVVAPSTTVTVAPGTPVPEIVGVVLFAKPPFAGTVMTGGERLHVEVCGGVQVKPVSCWQVALQPSPSVVLPSSHCSAPVPPSLRPMASTTPLPQLPVVGAQMLLG
jgi:hypothetical protein